LSKNKSNQFRIIGGLWKGRHIEFSKGQTLRPTKEAVRETVFNWLAPHITGSVCLDMFAGSGALSFEALSRGAKQVVMADQSSTLTRYYQQQAEILGAAQQVVPLTTRWPQKLDQLQTWCFDIIFLDPPFSGSLLSQAARWLTELKCWHEQSLIYTEMTIRDDINWLPSTWTIYRDKRAGDVRYMLIQPA